MLIRSRRVSWSVIGALVAGAVMFSAGKALAQGALYVPPSSELIPMGTTKGESYDRLIIQNAIIVDGRGSPRANRGMPAAGPIDLIIENGIITNQVLVDPVNLGRTGERGYPIGPNDKVIDVKRMYVIPGLVDMHTHLSRPAEGWSNLDFIYRVYLGHGVTTVRDAGTGAGMEIMAEQQRLSNANEIVAPRLVLCLRWTQPLRRWDIGNNPEAARQMVREFKERGADCVKISRSPGHYPDVMEAATDEANQLGMHVMVDLKVSETDAVVASNAGVASFEHWYGMPDAALPSTQDFPSYYNYWTELDRFRWAGDLWRQADEYPDRLTEAFRTIIDNGTTWNPTMVVYESNRDLWRSQTSPWQQTLSLGTYESSVPDSTRHGSYKTEWKTSDEIMWKENFRIWHKWVHKFHEMGGTLTAGSDAGGWGGIALIRELELFQEAGIHPIDIIRIATTNATKTLGFDDHCGIRVGCVADLAVINGNPLDNFKVMYGRGYGFYGMYPREELGRHGGVIWTIKQGIVFDAQALLKEAEWYVQQQKIAAATSSSGS